MKSAAHSKTLWRTLKRMLRARLRRWAAALVDDVTPLAAKDYAHRIDKPIDLVDALNLAGHAAGMHIWDWDIVAGTLRFDPKLLGHIDHIEDAGTNPQSLIEHGVHPDDRDNFRSEFIKALKGEAPLCIDYRIVHRDGSIYPLQLRGQVFRGPDGRATRIVGFTIDMSAQRAAAMRIEAQAKQQAEAQAKIEQQARQLQEWVDKVQLATETAAVGMWDWDLASGMLSSDINMAKIFPDADLSGITNAEEFVKRILHPDDREPFVALIKRVIGRQGGDRMSTQFRYINKNGKAQNVEFHGRIVRNGKGHAERLLGVSWNITAKVEAQQEIERQAKAQRELLSRLNLAAEVAGIDIWDWDLVNDRMSADAHLSAAYGSTHFDLIGGRQAILQLIHPEDADGYFAVLDRALESAQTFSHRFRLVFKDGSLAHVQTHARIFRDEHGKAIRLLGVTQNRTEEMQHLEELRRQADEERALRDRLNLATRTAGISIWDKDLVRGNFVSDDQFWKIFALPRNDLFKLPDGIHPDDRRRALAPMSNALDDPTRDEILAVRHRTSNPRPEPQFVQTHMRVFRDASGKAVRLLGVTWDVTAEEMRSEELRQKAEQERALLDRIDVITNSAGIAAWQFDFKTDKLVWHGKRYSFLGLDDVPLADYWDAFKARIVEEDRHLLVDEPRNAVMKGIENYAYEYRVHGADGKIYNLRNNCRLMKSPRGNYRFVMGVTVNITREVEANARLQQQSETERTLLNRMSVATQAAGISPWEFDLVASRFLWIGERLSVIGLDDEPLETYLASVTARIVPEDRAVLHEATTAALKRGENVYSYTHRVDGTDGKIHHIKNYVRVLRSANGTPYRLVGASWDMSEEVAAAENLKQQAIQERRLTRRLEVATQAAGISPWEYDLASRQFMWLGQRLSRIFGSETGSAEEYYRVVVERTLPEDRTIVEMALKNALENKIDVYSYNFRAIGIDDKTHHLKNFVHILRTESGDPYRLIGATWDVTEEVAVNEHLQQQAEQQRLLTERLNIATKSAGISSFELNVESGKFLWVENPIQALTNQRKPGTSFEVFSQRMHPEDTKIFHNEVVRAAKGGYDVINYRYRGIAADGGIVHVQSYAKLYFNEKRRAVRALGVSWDITKEVAAQLRFEEQARKERELTERLQMATQAAGISSWEIDVLTGKFIWAENSTRVNYDEHGDGTLLTFAKRMHPDDHFAFRDAMRRALKEGRDVISYRYRFYRANDSVAHIQSYAKLYMNDAGRVTRALGVSWDVTDEVNTKAQLEEKARVESALKERLTVATQAAKISTWEVDYIAGKFLWVENGIFASSTGEMSDLNKFGERMHPEDRDNFIKAAKTALRAGEDIVAYRYRYRRDDGSYAHIQANAKMYLNEQRRLVRGLGASWEITKEVEAAEKLRDAERRLERASLSSSEGHWETDLATGALWLSSSFHALLGYREGELRTHIGMLDELTHKDDRDSYRSAMQSHLDQDTPYDIELRLLTASGEYRWFRLRGAAERDAEGGAKLMAGSIHDIHHKKLIEDALQLAQLRFERAINGTQDGLWELDIDANDAWCSPRLALLLGYTAAELGAKNFLRTLVHPDDEPSLAATTLAHYRENAPFDLELRLQTRSGDYRWYRARARAERDNNGRARRLSGSLQDVTEAREAREELVRATEAAEAASRAKSAFLANVSHEIRTPMNGIVGMTGLLLDTRLDRTQREYADTIRGSADSLLAIINDILDFSKIEAGKLDLEHIELDLREIVEDVASMMAFQATNKGLELIVNVHPEVPERVMGDPQRLRQCLVNLLGNAIKFTKTGEIAIDVCAVGRHEDRVLTHFEIRDTGIGIPEATLKTLFQPFVQADSSTTRHFGGTGLGLSIVRRLIELMGGQVGVVSEIGKGSNFFFTLSLEPVDSAAMVPTKHAVAHSGRILIVDDNATNRRVLNLQLTHAGYRTTLAASGAEALETLHGASKRNEPIEMVITDFQMPDMDGAMLAARILEMPALANTRLVMLTSIDKPGDTQRLAALGFAAYLTKPIKRDELLNCVARVFSGEARQWQMEIRPMITRNSLAQIDTQKRFDGRVLLVEDNLVNQKVAQRFLERMGCSVRIAENGAEGVKAFTEEQFALVLMDLQMPVMDGLTAAREIRKLESADGKLGRTPIVALTANAMRGDQERCEAAGMDGYLTKPIEVPRLREVLGKLGLAVDAPTLSNAHNEHHRGAPPPINLAQLNALADNNAEFLNELLTLFVSSATEQLMEIAGAIGREDRVLIARTAHKLKGACANIHAHALLEIVKDMESLAANGSTSELQTQLTLLTREFDRAKKFLSDPSVMPMPIQAAS